MAVVQYGTGLRVGELLGLNWSVIDFEKQTIRVERQLTNREGMVERTKGKKARITYLAGEALDALQRLRKERPGIGDAPVFLTPRGNRVMRHMYYAAFNAARASLGLDHATTHMLRKRGGTALYEATRDIRLVAKTLGHASIELTSKVYVQDSDISADDLAAFEARLRRAN